MSGIEITGGSDDLIEITGAIVEEFNDTAFAAGAYVYVSTGAVVRLRLEVEGWRATVIHPGTTQVGVAHPLSGHTCDDTVYVRGSVSWVVVTTTAPARSR